MTTPKLEVLLFSFEQETGSREDGSVYYCEPLVVLATSQDKGTIQEIIEEHIEFSVSDDSYDEDFDRDALLEKVLADGFSASWQTINVYCNEG